MRQMLGLRQPFGCQPFGCGLLPALQHRCRIAAGHPQHRRPLRTEAAAQSSGKSIVARWAEEAGLKTNVKLEDFTGDRTESLKEGPSGPVTWPSEKWTEFWKVFFKPNSGYHDTFGVAWPMREDAPTKTEQEIEMARAKAARDLTNIDDPERKRRVIFGSALLSVTLTIMYVAARLHAHPLERVWLLLPFFLGAAEIVSGISGL